MKIPWSLGPVLAATFLLNIASGQAPTTSDGPSQFEATLNSFKTAPSIYSGGKGTTHLRIDFNKSSISYELSYSGLSSAVSQAHIHFSQKGVNGGIIVYLCDNTDVTVADGLSVPACPTSGTVTGTITAADVNPSGNPAPVTDFGIAEGDFAALVAAIQHQAGYVNVHTTTYPNGEIRGQLERLHSDAAGKQ